jgi:capsular polysaccharide export protein
MSAPLSRRILLLQGPRSPFFARLADALETRGAGVDRVLFCPGDALFWRGRPAIRFRDPPEAWPEAIRRILDQTGASDVVGLGDGRFWHAEAFSAAAARGAAVHVVEQGYLRPGWLTVERGALGAWRPSPGDLDAPDGPEPQAPPPCASFVAWLAMDVAWDLANIIASPFSYPHFRTHALRHPAAEWAGTLRRWARRGRPAPLPDDEKPLFLMALQLETDFQIRHHGPPEGLPEALRRVAASFAAHAPCGARLIVKPHPLDPGLVDWRRIAEAAAGERILWRDGGAIEPLLPRLAGLVTVNSTAGLTALRAGVPVTALGQAIYEPLCWRGRLDAFWREAAPPDPSRVRAFVRALAAATQVPGHFDGPRMAAGAGAVAERILAAPSTERQAA